MAFLRAPAAQRHGVTPLPAAMFQQEILRTSRRGWPACGSRWMAGLRIGNSGRKALLALFAAGFAINGAAAATPDRPEPGRQGETMAGEEHALPVPYSKGVNIIGHDPIGGRTGNLIMAWSGRCAYVADGMTLKADGGILQLPTGPHSGVAVIDVSRPSAPKTVRYLTDKGALNATETLAVSQGRGRPILAASTYGGVEGMSAPKQGWLSLYDASDCTHPTLLADIQWPEPVHTVRISPSGRYVYGPVLNPFTGAGGIAVMDISDPAKPHFLGKFGITRADGSSYQFAPHELVFSRDETRIYVGVVASQGGDLNRHFRNTRPGVPSAESVGPDAGGIYILDNSDFARGRPDPKFRLVGTAQQAGWHSPVLASIAGKPYLVNAGELGACPGAWPRITDISDEAHPRLAGEFRLAMNRVENCPPPTAMEKATGGLVGRAGIASSHFQDVDDADDTRLGLFSLMYAGLRIADLRSPANPVELAYFKPGDPCMSHVFYDGPTGHIWLACNASGFWVLELKPELRKALHLPKPARR
jgi:hypothetical protein